MFFLPKLRKNTFQTQRVSVTWPKLLQPSQEEWELDRYVFSPWLHKLFMILISFLPNL